MTICKHQPQSGRHAGSVTARIGSFVRMDSPTPTSRETVHAGFATPPTTSAMMVCLAPCPSLAAAKTYLARRAQFAMHRPHAREETPL